MYVKIPVTNTEGISSSPLIADLTADGLHLNVTGILTLGPGSSRGRVACRTAPVRWCPCSPVALPTRAVTRSRSWRRPSRCCSRIPNLELLWASPREVLNVCQAESVGCHIITVTHDLLKKLGGLGRSLEEVSLDTVRMFYRDAVDAGYLL